MTTRLRWMLGALLSLLSLAVAARALPAFMAHRLWLGSGAIALLAAIAVGGLVSLGRARQLIAAELEGLTAPSPGGALWQARRRRLEAIRARGAVLDREALAAATEAEVHGQAYLGRYLVAVAVLVGLVGTFAGLMETLRAAAPLIADGRLSTAQLLAAPLGGLDVTFAASILGILVTLGLSLVHGDLTLAEELLLARLEERTTHELIPSLWPPAEAAAERSARELLALRVEVEKGLRVAAEETAERVARAFAAAIERVAAAQADGVVRIESLQRALIERTEAALAGSTATEAERLRRLTEETASALATLTERAGSSLTASAQAVSSAVRAGAEATCSTMAGSLSQATAALEDGVGRAVGALATVGSEVARTFSHSAEAVTTTLTQTAERTNDLLTRAAERTNDAVTQAAKQTSATLAQAVERTSATVAQAVEQTSAALAEAAEQTSATLAEAAEQTSATLAHAAGQASATLAQAAGQATDVLGQAAERTSGTLSLAAERTTAALADSASRAAATVNHDTVELAAALRESTATAHRELELLREADAATRSSHQAVLSGLTEAHEAALASASARLMDALERCGQEVAQAAAAALGDTGARLEEAATALGAAAVELRAGTEALGPPVAALAPELSALAREVALLSVRGESEAEPLIADEMVRLGEGMERLEALLRLAKGEPS